MKKFSKNPIFIITLAALLTGFFMSLSFRSYNSESEKGDNRNKQLIKYIDNLEEEIGTLEEEINGFRGKITAIQEKQANDKGIVAGLNKNLDQLKTVAGLSQIQGSGIIITLDDNKAGAELAKKNHPTTYLPETFIVHDKNLLYLIKALSQYAEAISINNQRIVDASHIRCVGTVILVNASRLAPPYEIKIIGNSASLETALLESSEYNVLKSNEIPIKIQKQDNIIVPAYTGVYSTTYSQVVK